jgi:MFS family permease
LNPYSTRLVAPLLIGSLLNPINSTMISTALVPIGRDFHAGVAATAWLIAALYLASAVAQPAMGRIGDPVGPRRVLLAGLVAVGAAGVAGSLAPSLGALIGARVLLGIGTSAAYPSAMTILRAQAQKTGVETPRRVLGLLSLAALSSAAVGPPLGGVLTDVGGWQATMLVNVPLAAIGFVLALLWLPRDLPAARADEARAGLDVVGIVLFAATLTVLMVFLMDLGDPRWLLLVAFAALAAALAGYSLRNARPFLDLRMLAANRALSSTYLRAFLAMTTIYAVMYGFAQWLEDAHGFSAGAAGAITLPLSLGAAAASLLGARTRTIRGPLMLAAPLLLVGSLGLLMLDATTAAVLVAALGITFGVSQGLVSTGNQAAVYAQAPADRIGTASGLQRTSQYVGAITASSLIALMYGARASDAGLHELAIVMAAMSALLLLVTVSDRGLAGPGRRRGARPRRSTARGL